MYKEETSSVTSKVSGGSSGSILSLFNKSVVPRIYDGSEVASGCTKQSTKCEILSVYAPFEDTVGVMDSTGFYRLDN